MAGVHQLRRHNGPPALAHSCPCLPSPSQFLAPRLAPLLSWAPAAARPARPLQRPPLASQASNTTPARWSMTARLRRTARPRAGAGSARPQAAEERERERERGQQAGRVRDLVRDGQQAVGGRAQLRAHQARRERVRARVHVAAHRPAARDVRCGARPRLAGLPE